MKFRPRPILLSLLLGSASLLGCQSSDSEDATASAEVTAPRPLRRGLDAIDTSRDLTATLNARQSQAMGVLE